MRRVRSTLISMLALCAALVCVAQQASAARILGEFQGVYSGNDSEAAILTELGLIVTELAKVEWPSLESDGLQISNLTLNGDSEATAGWWDYSGGATVGLIVVKAGPQWAAYLYSDSLPGYEANLGLWNTADLSDRGVSHLTAYEVVPEPSTALMFGLGLLGLGIARRRS